MTMKRAMLAATVCLALSGVVLGGTGFPLNPIATF
jgi:hypothetical protein